MKKHQINIENAEKCIKKFIHHTPILNSESINKLTSAEIYFKCENFQKVGAFKMRGATNAILNLKGDIKGITTHSSGNHAQAVALAAKMNGYKAKIVMPNNAPKVKMDAVKSYGAEIVFCEPTLQAREDGVHQIIDEDDYTFVPPYDNWDVIYGQATVAKEIYDQIDLLDYLLVPIGGGGLMAGSCLSTKIYSPSTKIIGCEPDGADDAYQSFKQNKYIPQTDPQTIADGLKTSVGKINYPIIKEFVDEIFTVTDEEIKNAMKIIMERLKIVIEPSAAVPFAVLLKNKSIFKNKKIAIVISGGNIDLDNFKW